jgi:hypothetical protein
LQLQKRDQKEYFSRPVNNKPLDEIDYKRYVEIFQVPYGLQFLNCSDIKFGEKLTAWQITSHQKRGSGKQL